MEAARRSKVTTVLSASVFALLFAGLSPLPSLVAGSSNGGGGPALNPVQVTVQTKNITNVSSYGLVGYNSTGAPVASYTGQYPSITFDLPAGTYLFAATATGPTPSPAAGCCACAQPGVAASTPAQTKNSSSGPAIVLPCYGGGPPMEYGYSLDKVSGSSALTIATQPTSNIPTSSISVSVDFKNGTAVSGAYVYADVVGANWSPGDSSGTTTSNRTGAGGVARLVVPDVPLTVYASDSVQVYLPKSQTTVQVEVGGQLVNVTLYYSPNYVYLSASSLLVPPQTGLSMVLTAQAEPRPIVYAGGSVSSGGVSAPGAQGAFAANSTSTAAIASIPPIPASASASPAAQPPSAFDLWEAGTVVLAGVAAAAVGIAISKRR